MSNSRIHLSIPHMSGAELEFIHEAFETNWIAPLARMSMPLRRNSPKR